LVVVGLLAVAVVVAGTGLGLVLAGGPPAGGRTDPPAAGSRADPPPAGGRAGQRSASGKEPGGSGLTAVGALGTATGAAVPGTRSAYYEPPAATAAEAASPGQFVVTGRDAPDPFVLADDGTDYLYTSQGDQTGNNIPVAAGRSLTALGPLRDAMPALPAWAVPGFTWAPDVHRFGDHYVLYFTSIVVGTDPADQCIGIASGPSPLGPFTAEPEPFVCQLDQRGSIDPRTFTDVDGTTYLIWKSDDNADVNGTELTNIYSQPLSPDGLHLDGQPTRIFGPDEPWQGRIVEAPDLVWAQGAYWLFYSGAWFNQPGYAIGVARCAGPLGPCADSSTQPFLGSNDQGAGPGEPSVFRDAAGIWLLYTPWQSDVPSFTTPPRPVAMLRLGFGPAGPYVAAPTPDVPASAPHTAPPLEPPVLPLPVSVGHAGQTTRAGRTTPAGRAAQAAGQLRAG
jgi:hypothetical protein